MSRETWQAGKVLRQTLRRVPGVRALWGRMATHASTQRLTEDIDLLLKYGRFRPERVSLPSSSQSIFVDPRENRGRAILRGRAGGQPKIKAIWSAAIAVLDPAVVLDVGANYGEFVFAPSFRSARRIVAVEANPALMPWLERSRQVHPARDRIELVCALASETAGADVVFYVDTRWSGRSSTLLDPNNEHVRARRVPTTTVDTLLADERARGGALVFKIDVEGHETEVLGGMTETLRALRPHAGILEWNSEFLRKAGHEPPAVFARLAEGHVVHAVRPDGQVGLVDSVAAADAFFAGREGDLLVATDLELARTILAEVPRHLV